METKFVPQLLEPKEVILGAALTNFGPAFGVKKFVDGSFAVRYANGVVLYEQSGKVLDAGLDDVLMFPWGFKLFKKSNSPSWYLVDASGNNILCYIKCEAKKVYVSGNVIAMCDFDDVWRVFQINSCRPEIEYILISCHEKDIKIFQNKSSNDFVVAFIRDKNEVLLQHRVYMSQKVDKVAGIFRKFMYLPNEAFVCSKEDFDVCHYTDGCVEIHSLAGDTICLFDECLKIVANNVGGLFLLANDMYLLKSSDEWVLYSSAGKMLWNKIYQLSVVETKHGCKLVAETEEHAGVSLECVDHNFLLMIYGDEKFYFTPMGKIVKASGDTSGCWLI